VFDLTPFDLLSFGDIVAEKEIRDPRKTPNWSFHYIDIGCVSNATFQIVNDKQFVGSEAPSRARKVIRANDVIFATTRPYLKSIAQVPAELDGHICSTGFCVLRPTERVLSDWVFYCAISNGFLRQVTPKMRGANYPAVTDRDVLAAKVPLPPIGEQRRIVARIKECMERVEEIEELTKEQSEAESQILRAARREFLGGPSNLPLRWVEKRLDKLASVIYGISAAISKNKDPELGPPIVRMANISIDGHLNLSDLRYCPIPKGKADHFALKPGDLLLNWRSGSTEHVGKTALFNELGLYTCASFILRVRSIEGISNNRFLRHVLNFMRAEGVFSGQSRMQINHKLNATEFSAFSIRVPPSLGEQGEIADLLDAVEALSKQIRTEVSQKLDEARDLRESILSKAFAGEL